MRIEPIKITEHTDSGDYKSILLVDTTSSNSERPIAIMDYEEAEIFFDSLREILEK